LITKFVESLAQYEHRLRPLLLKLLGNPCFIATYSHLRPTVLKLLASTHVETKAPCRPQTLWNLTFRNDVGNAAGLDKDGSLLEFNYRLGAGFAVVGTVLHKPHTGNLYPLCGRETNPWTPLPGSHSAINSLGLPGYGIDPVLDRIRAFKQKIQATDFPIGLSIMGHPREEGEEKIIGVETCLSKSIHLVDFIEINESCPNVQHHDHSALQQRVERFCQLRNELKPTLPLWFKFSQCPDSKTLMALDEAGVQAIVLTNTQTDYKEILKTIAASDRALFCAYTQAYRGGISGEVIQSIAEQEILKAKACIEQHQLNLKLIHVGGLKNRSDMQHSRELAPLREWYSGFMEAMGRMPLKYIYPSLF